MWLLGVDCGVDCELFVLLLFCCVSVCVDVFGGLFEWNCVVMNYD